MFNNKKVANAIANVVEHVNKRIANVDMFPHLDHDGALLPVQLKVDLPHPVLVHLRRDDSEAVENPSKAIFMVQLVLRVHCSSSYCAREKHGQDSSQ